MRPDRTPEDFPDVRDERNQGNRDGDETESFFVEHFFLPGLEKSKALCECAASD